MDLDIFQITQQNGLELSDSEKNSFTCLANITFKDESTDARNSSSTSVPEQDKELEMGRSSPIVREQDEASPIIIPANSMCKQQFQCRICLAVFSKRWNCVSHMRAHMRVRPIFHCPTCGKKCSKQSELDIHVRIHTGEKPFSCSICQRRFTRQGQLNSHMRSHTGIKPYLCYDCGTSFASGSNLKRHQQLHAKNGSTNMFKKASIVENNMVENEIIGEGQKLADLTNGGLSSIEVNNSESHLPLVEIYEVQSSIPNCNTELSENPSFHASIITDTGNDNINTPSCSVSFVCEQSKNSQSENMQQLISQPIKAIPAMVPTQQEFILNPNTGDPLEEKVVKISEVFPSREDDEDTTMTTIETVQSDQQGNNSQDSEMADAWLERITQENGQLCLTDNATSVPSNEALPNVMQVDLSFLLEDTGLSTQDQSSDETPAEPLPNQLSQSLLPSSTSIISSTAYQTSDLDTAVLPAMYQLSNTLEAENSSPSVQLNVPGMVEGSAAMSLNGSILAQSEDTLAAESMSEPNVPAIVSIPHLPVINFSSMDQDTGQMMEVNQVPAEVKPETAPILVVLDSFYGAEQFQNMIADPPAAEDSKPIQLSVENASLPLQQQPVIHLSQPATDLITHGHDYSAAQTDHRPVVVKRQQVKSLSCDMCPRRFARQWYLTVHRNTHFREKTFTCDICSAKFSRVGNLNRHKQMHTGAKPFQCGQCQSRFATKYRLAEHERRHEGLKPYMCEICLRRFTDCSSLRRHQSAHKGDNLQYTCDVCGASFRTMHSLTFHLKLHVTDDGPGCVEQGVTLDEGESTPADVPIVPLDPSQTRETVTQIPCMLKSTDAKGRSTYLCSVCHKSFLFSAACRQHIFCHTGQRPYKCADCGAGFSRKACAKRHTHVHKREKRHQCQGCGKKFQTKPRLILHSDDHLSADMLTISCDECDKKFSEERLLIFHKKIFHRQQLSLYKPGVGLVERRSVRKKKQDLRALQHAELCDKVCGKNGSQTDSNCLENRADDKIWRRSSHEKMDRMMVSMKRRKRPAYHKSKQGLDDHKTADKLVKRKSVFQKKKKSVCKETEEGYNTKLLHEQASTKTEKDKDTTQNSMTIKLGGESQNNVTVKLGGESIKSQTDHTAHSPESPHPNSTPQATDQSFTRPRRVAALNQREFLASLQLKRKTRRRS